MEEKEMQKPLIGTKRMFVDIKYLALQIVDSTDTVILDQNAKFVSEIVSICEHGIYN